MAAFELIQHIELSSEDTNVEFTSIPQTYQHLYVVGSARSTRSSYTDGSSIRFNDRSQSGYYTGTAIVLWGPSSPGAWDSIGDPTTNMGYMMDAPADDSEDDIWSASHMWILDYTATGKFTGAIGGSSAPNNTGDTNEYQQTISHFQFGYTEAITSMKINNGVGNYAVGTAFTLYGLNPAATVDSTGD